MEGEVKVKVTICGSLKFESDVQAWHEALAYRGHTPYSMVVLPSQKEGNKDWYTEKQKLILDLIHLSKIEESDAILVVDTNLYIGESTAREILWAFIREKKIYYASEQSYVGSLDCFSININERVELPKYA